jgi:hypothetical protein
VSAALHRRARAIRERLAIRAWEYRQRDLAKGVWFRLRRTLVDAGQAFAIDDEDAALLDREGAPEASVGHELHPEKRIFWVDAARAAALASRRAVPIRLGPELLGARNLVLIRHGEPAPDRPTAG